MQTDKYTKVILTLIAIGLFLNVAMYLRVTPAGAASEDLVVDVLVADVVRTTRLEVMNPDGGARIVASGGGKVRDASSIHMYSRDGGVVLALKSFSGIGSLRLWNAAKNTGKDFKGLHGVAGVDLSAKGGLGDGGNIVVRNKTGDPVVILDVDEYGNGEVSAWNRKGEGRVFDSK